MSCHVDRLRCGQLIVDRQCEKLVTVVGHQFITVTVDICVQHGWRQALRRAGLSAAAKTCTLHQRQQFCCVQREQDQAENQSMWHATEDKRCR